MTGKTVTIRDMASGETHELPGMTPVLGMAGEHRGFGRDERPDCDGAEWLSDCEPGDIVAVQSSDRSEDDPDKVVWWDSRIEALDNANGTR